MRSRSSAPRVRPRSTALSPAIRTASTLVRCGGSSATRVSLDPVGPQAAVPACPVPGVHASAWSPAAMSDRSVHSSGQWLRPSRRNEDHAAGDPPGDDGGVVLGAAEEPGGGIAKVVDDTGASTPSSVTSARSCSGSQSTSTPTPAAGPRPAPRRPGRPARAGATPPRPRNWPLNSALAVTTSTAAGAKVSDHWSPCRADPHPRCARPRGPCPPRRSQRPDAGPWAWCRRGRPGR